MTSYTCGYPGKFCLCKYNAEGNTYLGGIDVLDIDNPRLVLSAELPNIDISSVAVENGKLYIAGAADVAKISGMESPVLVGDIQLTNGLLDDSYTYKGLQGYAATDVTYGDHYYYTATGDNGVLARLNKITST